MNPPSEAHFGGTPEATKRQGSSPTHGLLKYVILHHVTTDGEHWDLMIQGGPLLRTWRLSLNPMVSGTVTVPAERIGDHRIAYLEYEGPLSGDRGRVTRIDSGWCEVREHGTTEIVARFLGGRLAGTFQLSGLPGLGFMTPVAREARTDLNRDPSPDDWSG